MTIRELVTRIGFRVDERGLMVYDKAIGRVLSKTDQLYRNLDRVAGSIRALGTRLTLAVTLPLVGMGTVSVMAASNVESLTVSLTTMLKSADKANNLIQEMIAFAEKTPFQLEEVQNNAQMLIAMGFQAQELIPTMTYLGNAAAGTGANFTRLALNLGQVRTQGKLTGRDLRDFMVNRMPILEGLAQVLEVDQKRVRELVTEGKVGFKDVAAAFKAMSAEGGRFHNLMIARSRTLQGMWSNLIDSTFKLRVEIGNMILANVPLKKILSWLMRSVDFLVKRIKEAPKRLKTVVVWGAIILATVGPLLVIFGTLLTMFLSGKILLAALAHMGLIANASLGTLAATVGLLALKFIVIVGAIALVISVIAVLVDDFLVWRKGGDSLIGRFVGMLTGFGWTVRHWVDDLVQDVKDKFQPLIDWYEKYVKPILEFRENIEERTGVPKWLSKMTTRGLGNRMFPGLGDFMARAKPDNVGSWISTPSPTESFVPRMTPAMAGAGHGPVSLAVDSTINVTVPQGTTQEQAETISKAVQNGIRETWPGIVDEVKMQALTP